MLLYVQGINNYSFIGLTTQTFCQVLEGAITIKHPYTIRKPLKGLSRESNKLQNE
jgi:hypothetical protein